MANLESVLDLISDGSAKWLRVNEQPCMHTFIDDFYINICLYKFNNQNVISVDVDDISKGISDIVAVDIKEGEVFYGVLFLIYSNSQHSAENILLSS